MQITLVMLMLTLWQMLLLLLLLLLQMLMMMMRRRRRIYDHLRWLSTPLPGCVEIPAASLSSY